MKNQKLISSPAIIKILAVFSMVGVIMCALFLVILRDQSLSDIIRTSSERGNNYKLALGAMGVFLFSLRYLSPSIKELIRPTKIYLNQENITIGDLRIPSCDFGKIRLYYDVVGKGLVVPFNNKEIKINMTLHKETPAAALNKIRASELGNEILN